jgi:acid phosphatase family membrane protein YuiD
LALAFVVMLDANSLRNQVGKHAHEINRLSSASEFKTNLRERMGHTKLEIVAGLLVGVLVAFGVGAF